jgi:hypothetical protein
MKKNNIKCWWCISNVCSKTFYIPINITHNNKYEVIGNFCSVNCCLSYILNSYNIKNKSKSLSLLYKMYNNYLKSNNVEYINPAPPKELLTEFGGNMNYNSFKNKDFCNSTQIILPPLKSINFTSDLFIHPEKQNSQDTDENIMDNSISKQDCNTVHQKKKLTLKRRNPLKSNFVSIEKTMGLIKSMH